MLPRTLEDREYLRYVSDQRLSAWERIVSDWMFELLARRLQSLRHRLTEVWTPEERATLRAENASVGRRARLDTFIWPEYLSAPSISLSLEGKSAERDYLVDADRWRAQVEDEGTALFERIFQRAEESMVRERRKDPANSLLLIPDPGKNDGRVTGSLDRSIVNSPGVRNVLNDRLQWALGSTENRVNQILDSVLAPEHEGEDLAEVWNRVKGTAPQRRIWSRVAGNALAASTVNAAALEAAIMNGVTYKQWLCVAGDTRVRAVGATHIVRRWHSGQMVRLTLRRPAGGLGEPAPADRVLTVTPDHLVLTRGGWVEAQALQRGDDTFGRPFLDGSTGEPDEENMPPRIDEMFRAASLRGPGGPERVVAPGLDLDGEMLVGERDVHRVPVDRELRDVLLSTLVEEGSEGELVRCDRHLVSLLGSGSASEFCGTGAATSVAVGGLADGRHRGGALLLPPEASGVALGTDDGAHPHESSADRGLGRPVLLPEGTEGGSSEVIRYEVIEVEVVPWGGHVYDISTAPGWFFAEGMIVHNSSRDDRVRFTHRAPLGDGQTVGIRESFLIGGIPLQYPGDPVAFKYGKRGMAQVYGCRCTMAFHHPDDEEPDAAPPFWEDALALPDGVSLTPGSTAMPRSPGNGAPPTPDPGFLTPPMRYSPDVALEFLVGALGLPVPAALTLRAVARMLAVAAAPLGATLSAIEAWFIAESMGDAIASAGAAAAVLARATDAGLSAAQVGSIEAALR